MRGPITRESGFTLVELIVASTLMALVLSGVYVTFSTVVRSWRSAESNYATYEDTRRALGLLERELHSIPGDAIHLMRGKSDSIEFVTLSQPLDVETAPGERLMRVQYRLVEDRTGGKLVRTEALVQGALPGLPDPQSRDLPASLKTGRSREFEIARGAHAFELEYAWAGPARPASGGPPPPVRLITDTKTNLALPQLITITLELDDPGNPANGARSAFTLRVTFRGPTSPMPDELRLREGI
jgi:prepilin-type N-terminal cleavage/methylation domain-containing protein